MNNTYFTFTPDEVVESKNLAMADVLNNLQAQGLITNDDAVKFSEEYTFVSIRNRSLLTRLRDIIFPTKKDEDKDKDRYCFPLICIRKDGKNV